MLFAKVFLFYLALGIMCSGAVPELKPDTHERLKMTQLDYRKWPVKAKDFGPVGAAEILEHTVVGAAFDGYGAQGTKPAATGAWIRKRLPSADNPIVCEIDYGQPVGVKAFVNYCYTPGSKDLRFISPAPSSFKRVRILARAKETDQWAQRAMLEDLPAVCPQTLPITDSTPARYWRLEILELVQGAEMLCTYELETWTGPVLPVDLINLPPETSLPAVFAKNILSHKGIDEVATATLSSEKLEFDYKSEHGVVRAELELQIEGQARQVVAKGPGAWVVDIPQGTIQIQTTDAPLGTLLNLAFEPKKGAPLLWQRVTLKLKVPKPQLYFVPAYAWNRQPVEMMANMCHLQTRMAALQSDDLMICYIPGTDRGSLGFSGGEVSNELLLGHDFTPVVISAIMGDWWTAYRFATREIYQFDEQSQSVPVSEIQNGISRFMMTDEVWQPELGTVRSYPNGDFVDTDFFHCYDNFTMYGTPYSIPLYWARYVMNSDAKALERCRSIAHWLCRSGVRVQTGPAKGGFFSTQRIMEGKKAEFNQPGCNVSGPKNERAILTGQSTGAALWSLLYYRKVTEVKDPEVDETINEAIDWLLRLQLPDGGWAYAYDLQGKAVEGAPSSGAIWNIWSLWRFGKETNDEKCLQAAERGKQWFIKTFVKDHFYHGYWEDVGPGSREGYEAAIAVVAFAEMGDDKLAVEIARDSIQWVFTRQIEPREKDNSAGLVAEQTSWPPASYCNPMMGLAAWTAWQITKDDFWQPFAKIPKAIGWWYEPETGAMAWIVESLGMAPIINPTTRSYWNDWCIGQDGTLALRWLIREVNRRMESNTAVDEERLKGKFLGQDISVWSPPSGFHPRLPVHGQVNWLGLRGKDSVFMALMNDAGKGDIDCPLSSRDVGGVTIWPKQYHELNKGKIVTKPWDGLPLKIQSDALLILEWGVRP